MWLEMTLNQPALSPIMAARSPAAQLASLRDWVWQLDPPAEALALLYIVGLFYNKEGRSQPLALIPERDDICCDLVPALALSKPQVEALLDKLTARGFISWQERTLLLVYCDYCHVALDDARYYAAGAAHVRRHHCPPRTASAYCLRRGRQRRIEGRLGYCVRRSGRGRPCGLSSGSRSRRATATAAWAAAGGSGTGYA